MEATPRPILVALGSEARALRLIQAAFRLAREKAVPWMAECTAPNRKVAESAIVVNYDPAKINEQQIKMAIAKTGFAAGDMAADPTAYDNLDDCCKKK